MEIRYQHHLPNGFETAAVRLYFTALRDKLVPLFGDDTRAHSLMARHLRKERCIAALCGDELAGIVGIQTVEGGFLNPSPESLFHAYGVMGGLFRMGGLLLLHHETAPDEIYIDGIVVAEKMRGKGIGSHLLRLLEEKARERGMRIISLEVIDSNPRAARLYEKEGFTSVKRRTLRPFNRIMRFPFHSAILMEKPLARAPEN